jgi:hypothetical protein
VIEDEKSYYCINTVILLSCHLGLCVKNNRSNSTLDSLAFGYCERQSNALCDTFSHAGHLSSKA